MIFLAAENSEKDILDVLKLFEELSAIQKIFFLFVIAVSTYLLFWWIIKTTRNKPSYRFLFKRELPDEVPKIGILPYPIIIFVVIFFASIFIGIIEVPISKYLVKSHEFTLTEFYTIIFYANFVTRIILAVLVVLLLKKYWTFPIGEALFGGRKRFFRDIFASFIIFIFTWIFAILVLNTVWQLLLKQLDVDITIQEAVILLMNSKDINLWIAMSLAIVIAAPIFEEIIFRGFLYGGLRKRFSATTAALISGIIFG